MRAVLCTWNLKTDTAGKLRYFCLREGIGFRPVGAAECSQPIRKLVIASPSAESVSLPFPDEMLLMAGFTSLQLDRLLEFLREKGIPIPLKAVMTASNARWDSLRLYQELCAEHQAMNGTP